MPVLTPHQVRDVDSLCVHRQEDLAREDVHILQVECHLHSEYSVKQGNKKHAISWY